MGAANTVTKEANDRVAAVEKLMSEMEVTHQREKEADGKRAREQMSRQAGLIDAMQGRLGRVVGENGDLRKDMARL